MQIDAKSTLFGFVKQTLTSVEKKIDKVLDIKTLEQKSGDVIAAPEIQSVVLTESTDPRSSPEPSNTPENPVAINQNETKPIDNKDQKETLQSKILQLESDAAQKQQRIDELVQEGSSLAELNGRLVAAAKKLKTHNAELQETLKQVESKYIESKNMCAELTDRAVKLKEAERCLEELKASNKASQESAEKRFKELEQQSEQHKSEKEELREQLDAYLNEIDELKQQNREAVEASQSKELEAEMKRHEQTRTQLETSEAKIVSLQSELDSQRRALDKVERELAFKEEEYSRDNADYQRRIVELEERNEVLQNDSSSALTPYLAQIEMLQLRLSDAEESRKSTELHFYQKLQQAEKELQKSEAQVKSSTVEMTARVKEMEVKLEDLQRENIRLKALIEKEQTESRLAAQQKLDEQLAQLEQKHRQELAEMEQEHKSALCSQLEHAEREWAERLGKEQARVKELSEQKKESTIDGTLQQQQLSPLSPRHIEHFNNEAFQLQSIKESLAAVNAERDYLSAKIVQLTVENRELERLRELEKEYRELTARYQTTLVLLGEKTEKVQELELDLQEAKEAYKDQILQLLKR